MEIDRVPGYFTHLYTSAQSLINSAQLAILEKNYSRAARYYSEACKLMPSNVALWIGLAECLKAGNWLDGALQTYYQAASVSDSAAIQTWIGLLHEQLTQPQEALTAYERAIWLDSSQYEAYNNKANLLRHLGFLEESVKLYVLGLQRCGPNHDLYNNLGNAYLQLNLLSEAEKCYAQAIQLKPSMAAAHCNLASVLKLRGCIPEALSRCEQAIISDPGCSEAYASILHILIDNPEEIVTNGQKILDNSNSSLVLLNLGNFLKENGKNSLAVASYTKALEITPWFPEAFCNMVYTKIFICDWRDRIPHFHLLRQYIKYQIEQDQLPTVQPFHALVYPIAPEDKLLLAKKYAAHARQQVAHLPAFANYAKPGPRIRVGYVSSDFANHPLSHLFQSVVQLHDRSRFEIYCFALTPSDHSEYRRFIEAAADYFVDLSGTPDAFAAASLIHSSGIDVLVNLNGYTKGARNDLFALKPGRVQLNMLGYPATMGADYIQYIVSDAVVTPTEFAKYYSERIIYMPHSYFVNDYRQSACYVLDSPRPTRADLGLPEDKFIFCNFNQLYKIDPETFDIWLRILQRVPNSILWLLRFPPEGEQRLKDYASQRIHPSRLLFTDVADKRMHIQRAYLADLFLDTPLCNGHTTCCDVLWSGLPVLTLPLQNMASRVAASLCTAAGCAQTVAKSATAYEEMAVRLATGPRRAEDGRWGSAELAGVRKHLQQSRLRVPLFDTKQWVADLEKALQEMVRVSIAGEPATDIRVSSL